MRGPWTYHPPFPGHSVVRVVPLGAEADSHVAEEVTDLHTHRIGPVAEVALVDRAVPGHEDSQVGVADAVLTDIVEMPVGAEPALVLLLEQLFHESHRPTVSALPSTLALAHDSGISNDTFEASKADVDPGSRAAHVEELVKEPDLPGPAPEGWHTRNHG